MASSFGMRLSSRPFAHHVLLLPEQKNNKIAGSMSALSLQQDGKSSIYVDPDAYDENCTILPIQIQDHVTQNRNGTGSSKYWLQHCQQCMFNMLPILVLVLYIVLGATAFYLIERNPDANTDLALYDQKLHVSEQLCRTLHPNTTENCTALLIETLKSYDKQLMFYYRPIVPPDKWSFAGSLVYSITLVTAIGYGDAVPITKAGRILTIFYSLFGIPLMFFLLARIGRLLCLWIHRLWRFLLFLLCNYAMFRSKELENIAAVEELDFPFSLAIMFTISWWFASSAIFMYWEKDWDFLDAVYFSYITISTIGLGDLMPADPRSLIVNSVFIIWGLAMVSMCINLMQIKLDRIFRALLNKIKLMIEAEPDTYEMEKDALYAEREINELLKKQAKWAQIMLGRQKKSALLSAWKQKARMKVKAVQTDKIESRNIEVFCCADSKDVTTQVGGRYGNMKTLKSQVQQMFNTESPRSLAPINEAELPLRETPKRNSKSQTDEFKRLLKEIGYVLSDCREIVNGDDECYQ